MPDLSSNPPTPTPVGDLPEIIPAEEGFLAKNLGHILRVSGFIILAAACVSIYQCGAARNATKAASALAAAHSEEELRAMIASHPRAAAADSARMILGDQLLRAGKPDQSLEIFKEIAGSSRDSTLAATALLAVSGILESQGKLDEAATALAEVQSRFPKTYVEAHGLIAQAKLAVAKGNTEDARRLYEQVRTEHSDTIAARDAQIQLAILGPSEASQSISVQSLSAPTPQPAAAGPAGGSPAAGAPATTVPAR